MRVLVVAVSARMLAQLAVADGYRGDGARPLWRRRHARDRPRSGGAGQRCAGRARRRTSRTDAVVYGAGFENRPDLVARLADGRELLGTPAERLAPCATRGPWGRRRERPGRVRPETRSAARADRRRPAGGCASHAGAAAGAASGGGRAAGCARTEILQRRIDGLSCSAVAIARRPARRRARPHRAAASPARIRVDGKRDAAAPARRPSWPSSTASCARSATRWRRASACAARSGSTRSGTGATPGCSRSTRDRPASLELFGPGSFEAHVRGARGLGLPTAGMPPATRCAKVKLVLFADRDVQRSRARLVAVGARARHPACRRDHQARRSGVHAGLGDRRRGRARRARSPPAGRAARSGARPWLRSARSRALAVVCCATTSMFDPSRDVIRLEPHCELGAEWFSERVRRAASAPAATIDGRARRPRDGARAAPASCCAARAGRCYTGSTAPRWRTRAPRSRWPTGSARWSRTGPLGGAVARRAGGPAARRLDRHAGRDPRPLAPGRDLARGPETTHPRLLERLGFGGEPPWIARSSSSTTATPPPRGAPTCSSAGRRDHDLDALTSLHVLQRGLALRSRRSRPSCAA